MYSAYVKDSENADRWLAALSSSIVHLYWIWTQCCLPGQTASLQLCVSAISWFEQPWSHVRLLDCSPGPHDTLQLDQSLQIEKTKRNDNGQVRNFHRRLQSPSLISYKTYIISYSIHMVTPTLLTWTCSIITALCFWEIIIWTSLITCSCSCLLTRPTRYTAARPVAPDWKN